MPNSKENNNEALELLKGKLTKALEQIPKSENGLAIDFMKNVWAKLFVVKKDQTPIDIHSVISYIDSRMKNTKSKQHQAFWAKIVKMLLETAKELNPI